MLFFSVLQSLSPSSGSSLGGTVVRIVGTFDLGGNPLSLNQVRCVFGNSEVVPENITITTVTCKTPPRTLPSSMKTHTQNKREITIIHI
jgi:hypothetical protein